MGTSSSLVIAELEDISKIEASMDPVREFGGMFSRMHVVPLWYLMDIINGGDEYITKMEGFKQLNNKTEPSPDGPWITSIHSDLKPLLYSIPEAKKIEIAERWSKIEEVYCSSEELLEIINGMINCFREADSKGKTVFVVNSL